MPVGSGCGMIIGIVTEFPTGYIKIESSRVAQLDPVAGVPGGIAVEIDLAEFDLRSACAAAEVGRDRVAGGEIIGDRTVRVVRADGRAGTPVIESE